MLIDILHRLIRLKLKQMGFQSRCFELTTSRLHYYEYRHRNPKCTVVLLHGLGTSSGTWVHVAPFFIKEHNVIAIDLPGFGFSELKGGRTFFKIAEHCHAIENLVDHLALESFVLIGHSFGGWIAAQYASAHPQRIEQLILINTAGVYYRRIEELRRTFTINSVTELRHLLSLMWYRYPWHFKLFTRAILNDMINRKVNEIVASIEPRDLLTEEFTRLNMPVSIIWGNEDRLIPQETVHAMCKMILHVHIHFLAQCGHVPQLERPRDLIDVLDEDIGVKQYGLG